MALPIVGQKVSLLLPLRRKDWNNAEQGNLRHIDESKAGRPSVLITGLLSIPDVQMVRHAVSACLIVRLPWRNPFSGWRAD